MAVTAIKAATRLYSIAAAPRLLPKKARTILVHIAQVGEYIVLSRETIMSAYLGITT